MNLLAYEGDLKLPGLCNCGRTYAKPENNVHIASIEEVEQWLVERKRPKPDPKQLELEL